MKRKRILLTSMLLLLAFHACNDEFLEIENPNTITTANFWQTEEDAHLGVVACYSQLLQEGNYRQWHMWMYELRSDLGWNNSAWGDFSLYTKFIISNYNFELNTYVYRDKFRGINRCNQVLANVPKIEFQDEQLKNRLLAEVKFLRALFYYDLTILYGHPPLVLKPTTGTERPGNATREELWTQIEKDLTEAIPHLPWQYAANDPTAKGRVTKGAARSLLGKAYMQQHKWEMAANEFKQVIDQGIYQLVPNFEDNFRPYSENNAESIFEIQFSDISSGDWPDYNTPLSPLGNKWPQYIAPRQVGGHSDGQPSVSYVHQFTDTTYNGEIDPRKDLSLFHRPGQHMFGVNSITYTGFNPLDTVGGGWPRIWYKKYSSGYEGGKTLENYNSPVNFRLIRYADILLLYAEALNELDQTSDAYQYIDMVRQRPNVNIVRLSEEKPNLSIDDMRKQIEHERIVELGGEGLRWQDLVRYGYLDSQEGISYLRKRDPEFKTYVFPRSKYLPIPQRELDINPNLLQNEGW